LCDQKLTDSQFYLLHGTKKNIMKKTKTKTEMLRRNSLVTKSMKSVLRPEESLWLPCLFYCCLHIRKRTTTTHTTTVFRPFFRDHPGEPVPEENFWTLWCKGRLTEADTQTIQLGATPSGLTTAHLHHHPIKPHQTAQAAFKELLQSPNLH